MRTYASSRANECVERDGINRTIWVERNKSQSEREREREREREKYQMLRVRERHSHSWLGFGTPKVGLTTQPELVRHIDIDVAV